MQCDDAVAGFVRRLSRVVAGTWPLQSQRRIAERPERMPKNVNRAPEVRDLTLAGGRRLRVRLWPGTGKPLVLLHGLLDDSEGWVQVANDTERPCLAIDLPGFGAS